VFRELMATGAVISGRRTFELAGRWQGDHHDGVPIFVLTHHIDDGDVPPGSARFVTDVEACGRSLFGSLGPGHTELELVRVLDAPGVLHLRYRVQGAR
jgi:hypothetical protein